MEVMAFIMEATEATEVFSDMEGTTVATEYTTEATEVFSDMEIMECTIDHIVLTRIQEATDVIETNLAEFRMQAMAVTQTDTITTIEVQTAVIGMKGLTTDHRGPEVHQLLLRSSFPSAWVAAVGGTETTVTTVATSLLSTQKSSQSS